MAEDTKKTAETNETKAAPAAVAVAAPKARTPKVNDTVHLVQCSGKTGNRFGRVHAEAEVLKVHKGGRCVDLIVHNEDDPAKSVTITSSPFDESGQQLDSWHLPEQPSPASSN